MKFGYFSQLQMPKPWRENGEVLLYKEAMEQAVHAESVGRWSRRTSRRAPTC